jgi:fermentation-respiration switch protein FrsA (DUF1100 family)
VFGGAIGIITKAIAATGPAQFAGLKPGWDTTPEISAFLTHSHLAVPSGFTLQRPTLIVQGTNDAFVPEPLTTAFLTRLKARGAPVTYKTYPGADHFTLILQSDSDMLVFLQTLFHS